MFKPSTCCDHGGSLCVMSLGAAILLLFGGMLPGSAPVVLGDATEDISEIPPAAWRPGVRVPGSTLLPESPRRDRSGREAARYRAMLEATAGTVPGSVPAGRPPALVSTALATDHKSLPPEGAAKNASSEAAKPPLTLSGPESRLPTLVLPSLSEGNAE